MHTIRDITMDTLDLVTLIITDKMSTQAEYVRTMANLKANMQHGTLTILDATIIPDTCTGNYMIECISNNLQLNLL